MSIVRINDTIELAKELALEIELQDKHDQDMIISALHMMNAKLLNDQEDQVTILKAAEAYAVPYDRFDVEFIPEKQIVEARIAEPIVKGRVHSFNWFGSVSLTGFGLRMFGVDFYQPKINHTETVLVPIETIDLRLSA